MAKKKAKSTQRKKLTAHGLLGSISYWGTTTRVFLASMLVAFAFVVNLSAAVSAQYVDAEIMFFIYGVSTLLILDLGYVVAARALPLNPVVDRWVVTLSDLGIAGFFVAPSIVMMNANGNYVRLVALIGALLIVAVRILVGLLFAKRK